MLEADKKVACVRPCYLVDDSPYLHRCTVFSLPRQGHDQCRYNGSFVSVSDLCTLCLNNTGSGRVERRIWR